MGGGRKVILLIMALYALYLLKTENWIGLAGLVFGFLLVNMFHVLNALK